LRQSMLMAWLGQTSTHAPQSPHVDSSMTATPSFIAMAPKGQDSIQASQPVHLSAATFTAIDGLPRQKCNLTGLSNCDYYYFAASWPESSTDPHAYFQFFPIAAD
jgi:hypothetical protein